MEIQQSWRVRLSFKNATILITILNVIAALILLQGFLSSFASSRDNLSSNQLTSGNLFLFEIWAAAMKKYYKYHLGTG